MSDYPKFYEHGTGKSKKVRLVDGVEGAVQAKFDGYTEADKKVPAALKPKPVNETK